jgi:hypothetical protein
VPVRELFVEELLQGVPGQPRAQTVRDRVDARREQRPYAALLAREVPPHGPREDTDRLSDLSPVVAVTPWATNRSTAARAISTLI